MKKIIFKVLCLMTVFISFLTCIDTNFNFSASKPELSVNVSKTDLKRGDEFTAIVNLNTNSVENILGLQISLKYDSNILEPVGEPVRNMPNQGNLDNGLAAISYKTSSSNFFWTYSGNGLDYNGQLWTTKFKVKDNANIGNTSLIIDVDSDTYPIQGLEPETNNYYDVQATINNSKVDIKKPINSISFGKTNETLNIGDIDNLEVAYDPSDTTYNKAITWTNSNKNIVVVSNGRVKAVGPGTATIVATVDNKVAKCTYTVKLPLNSISLGENISMIKNQTKKLSVKYNPENTTDNKTITWSSGDETVVSVDENGKIKGLKAGSTTITATVGDKIDTINVEVTEVPLNTIFINELEDTLMKGEKFNLTVTCNLPDIIDNKAVTWKSSNPKIAKIDKYGNIEALKEGKTTITATVGTKESSIEITVKEVHLDSVSLIKEEKQNDNLVVGEKIHLKLILNPENCTDEYKVKFSSSDWLIASVDKYGNVELKKEGNAIIKAKLVTEYGKEVIQTINLKILPSEKEENLPKIGELIVFVILIIAVVTLTVVIIIKKKEK